MSQKSFPYEIKDLNSEVVEKMKLFTGERGGFVSVGPKEYVMPKRYEEIAADIYNMEVRPSDVYVLTFPRSGTTWTQELIWLVGNDFDFEKAKETKLALRFPYLEFAMMFHPNTQKYLREIANKDNVESLSMIEWGSTNLANHLPYMPAPRFVKSHLPFSLLPQNILDSKVVYVARDPRDTAVSFYHLCQFLTFMKYDGDFKGFWKLFLEGHNYYTPYFEHVKEAWEKRNHPNLLFLFYEDLQKDLPAIIRRIADFLGKDCNDEQVQKLSEHLSFSNFKNNDSVNSSQMKDYGLACRSENFVRKGKTGGWRDYFDEEMTAQAQKWIEDNLKDTDLRFSTV